MDTNIEPQINSFAGGMNSDDDISVVPTNQYLEAKNLKIVSFQNDNKHGSIMPIRGVKLAGSIAKYGQKIVATGQARDIGVIVCKDDTFLRVLTFKNAIGGDVHSDSFNSISETRTVVDAPLLDTDGEEYPDVFNIQLNYESEHNVKLYIADSIHPIMVFNINRDDDFIYNDLNKCLIYPEAVCKPPVFEGYIPGKIGFSVVSYCYQLYNRYGVYSGPSVQCKQIPIGNYDFTSNYIQSGGKQEAQSNCGVKMSIQIPSNYWQFDYIKVFRVQYTQNGQMPIVSVIYDSPIDFDQTNSHTIVVNDVGNEPIEQISVEELNSLQGVRIIPNSLAIKDNLMFAANVKTRQTTIKDFDKWDARAFRFNNSKTCIVTDVNGNNKFIISTSSTVIEQTDLPDFTHDCYDPTYNDINNSVELNQYNYVFDSQYRWVGGSGKNIEWRFIICPQVEDACVKQDNTRKIGTIYNYSQKKNIKQNNIFYIDNSFQTSAAETADLNPGISDNTWLIKSLRRNEIYRYGIVLYDKYGQASPVKWIADIRTPNITDPGFQLMSSNTTVNGTRYELVIRDLGIQFMVKNLPTGCTGYEIVRCARHESDIATISQGVLSSPVSNAYSRDYSGDSSDYTITKYHTFCPTGFLTTNKFIEGYYCHNHLVGDGKDGSSPQCMTNIDNNKLLQFVSKEVCYQPESFKQFIKDKNYYLDKQQFLFGARGDAKFRDDLYDSPNTTGEFEDLVGYNDRTSFRFIIPCISNCAVELFTGQYDDGRELGKIHVNDMDVEISSLNRICYLEAPYNITYFCKLNPCAHEEPSDYTQWWSGSTVHHADNYIGGYSNERPYSFALIKDCILNFDNMYTQAESVRNSRTEVAGRFVVQKAFAYIKLYEQGLDTRAFIADYNDPFYVETRGNIQDFQIVDQIKWNEAFKRNYNKDEEEQRSSKAYINKSVSSGGMLYTNMVTGGISTDTNSYILEGFGCYSGAIQNDGTEGDSRKNVCFGTGGRCLLISCKYSEAGTAGATQYLVPSHGDCLDNLVSETDSSLEFTTLRPTLLGTYLTNLRQQVAPYGGASFTNRLANVYYGDGDYFEATNSWNTVFDGDCHVETFEYTSMHKIYGAYTNNGSDDLQFPNTHMIMYSIPTESNIWCRFQYGWSFSENARDNYASFIQEEPSEITEAYVQEDPQYVYNTVYSVQNTSIPLAVYDDINPEDYNKTIDTRVYNSDLKQNDEITDSWARFKSSNFIDVDQAYGAITNIYTFKNQLLFFQEQSAGVLSVNDRSVATDNSGQSIVLGTGGILSRYDYYSNTYGMHKQQFCAVGTTGGLYWFDSHNNTICLFDGQSVVQLSKQGKVQMLLNNLKKADGFRVYYDNRYNEVVFNVLKDDLQIGYSEMLGKFTSLYTLPFDGSASFTNGGYLIKVNDVIDIFQYDCMDNKPMSTTNTYLSCYLKYTVNQQPMITKVFDNQQFVTADDLQSRPMRDIEDYFSKDHSYTWKTPMIESSSTLEKKITLRENNHRFAIPRSEGLYGGRIRGNYMTCEIFSNNPNPDASIQYIITQYRRSWS